MGNTHRISDNANIVTKTSLFLEDEDRLNWYAADPDGEHWEIPYNGGVRYLQQLTVLELFDKWLEYSRVDDEDPRLEMISNLLADVEHIDLELDNINGMSSEVDRQFYGLSNQVNLNKVMTLAPKLTRKASTLIIRNIGISSFLRDPNKPFPKQFRTIVMVISIYHFRIFHRDVVPDPMASFRHHLKMFWFRTPAARRASGLGPYASMITAGFIVIGPNLVTTSPHWNGYEHVANFDERVDFAVGGGVHLSTIVWFYNTSDFPTDTGVFNLAMKSLLNPEGTEWTLDD